MGHSESLGEIAKALSAVQKDLQPAPFNGHNSFYNSKYADLNSVWESCRALLNANGLAVSQTFEPSASEHCVDLITVLLHTSGEYLSGRLTVPYGTGKDHAVKVDPQGMGIGIMYGRRYSLAAIVGIIADTDTDGEGRATGRKPAPKPQQRQEPAPQQARPDDVPAPDSITGARIPIPPPCPKCKGEMWDNRDKRAEDQAEIERNGFRIGYNGNKTKSARPAWACKDKDGCGEKVWPSDPNNPDEDKPQVQAQPPQGNDSQPPLTDDDIPF